MVLCMVMLVAIAVRRQFVMDYYVPYPNTAMPENNQMVLDDAADRAEEFLFLFVAETYCVLYLAEVAVSVFVILSTFFHLIFF